MAFPGLDTAAVARALAQIADRPDDWVDTFFERSEEVEVAPEGEPYGLRMRREEGLAVRLVRAGNTWHASRDAISTKALAEALRQVARVLPPAPYPLPDLTAGPWPDRGEAPELFDFAPALHRAIRRHHVAFPLRVAVRRHRRWVQVVGPRLVPEPETEVFYSCAARMPTSPYGALFVALDEASVESVARSLVGRFQARQAPVPPAGKRPLVMAPAAAAVLLHEAVAHALEADLLALGGGRPEAAIGVALGPVGLHVLDDPEATAPAVARQFDDEGNRVHRRWLVRNGAVEQPLADVRWSARSEMLAPGAGRRGNRHDLPSPRSSFLELLPGTLSRDELLAGAEGGLYLEEVSRGRLDPLTGAFELEAPYARRIRSGATAEPVGPFRVRGTVAEFLAAIDGIGRDSVAAGAGWCAKGGAKLPVWASAPALRLSAVEVAP